MKFALIALLSVIATPLAAAGTTTGAPTTPREGYSLVWTGSLLVVWGGKLASGETNTGGRYNPAADGWGATSTVNAPQARFGHTTVWTGTGMIVYGGWRFNGTDYVPATGGGRYNPASDSWTPLSTTGAPTDRGGHAVAWTGTTMLVWGGATTLVTPPAATTPLGDGAAYNVASNSWLPMSAINAPSARETMGYCWTGTELVVWGGYDGARLADGARYSAFNDTWTPMTVANAPSARIPSVFTFATDRVFVGRDELTTDYFVYNLGADSWSSWSVSGVTLSPLSKPSAVWTGSVLVCRQMTGASSADGMRYDPVSGIWGNISDSGAPMTSSPAVLAGTRLMYFNDSGVYFYDAVADAWVDDLLVAPPDNGLHHGGDSSGCAADTGWPSLLVLLCAIGVLFRRRNVRTAD